MYSTTSSGLILIYKLQVIFIEVNSADFVKNF